MLTSKNFHQRVCSPCSNTDCTRKVDVEAVSPRVFEDELHAALSRDQFFLVYQPIVDTRTGSIVALEALLRWRHPDYGVVTPYLFIPVAERLGLIEPIGIWVLRQACQDASKWPSDVRVSVNFSAPHFCNSDFPNYVTTTLNEFGLAPKRLEIEITERSLLSECQVVNANLRKLSEAGVRLAIDDFGCGYSSLNYLCWLPIDTVKIDQSFCRGLTSSVKSLAVVGAISALAHELSFDVIAEGVETNEQLQIMLNKDINLMQGYFYSVPLGLEEVSELLVKRASLTEETKTIDWSTDVSSKEPEAGAQAPNPKG